MLCRIAKAKTILDVRRTMLLSSSAMSNQEIYDVSRSGKSKSEFEVPRGPAVMLLSTKLSVSSDERPSAAVGELYSASSIVIGSP